MDFYPFRFDVKRLRPLLQRDLYTNPDVAIRELAQNAHDAILRRARIEEKFNPERDGEIVFHIDPIGGTLSVSDNGVGMSRDRILNVFRYYGRSDKEANDEVGTFGIGAKSIFARADSFTIHTRNLGTGETSQVYATLEGLAFQPSPPTRESPGTTITVPSQVKENDLQRYRDALDKYCRSVKVPMYVQENGKTERCLVSQKTPWHVKCTCIQGDGFDIYVAVSDYDDKGSYIGESSRGLFCVEGFSVSEARYDITLAGVAINLTRKDLANLTMSRDNFIKDKKYEALPGIAISTIAAYVAKMDFGSLKVLESQAGFIEWLGQHRDDSPLWKQLPNDVQMTIRILTDKISVCPTPDEEWRSRDKHKTTLLKVLLAPKPKYFLFGRPRQVVEELAIKKNAIIIYHQCAQDKKPLKERLIKYRIHAFNEDAKSRRYAVCTPCGVEYYNSLVEFEAAYQASSEPKQKKLFFIFPRQVPLRRLQQTAGHLDIYATKLEDTEVLEGNWIDLRKTRGKDVVFEGKPLRLDSVDVDNRDVAVAPPEFFRFAQAAKSEPIIFTQDVTSLCLLVSRGANVIGTHTMQGILEATLPKEICDELCWWRLRDANDYRAVASLAASLDWKNPYSTWLFTLASNSDSVHDVATNPTWTTVEEIHIEKAETFRRQ